MLGEQIFTCGARPIRGGDAYTETSALFAFPIGRVPLSMVSDCFHARRVVIDAAHDFTTPGAYLGPLHNNPVISA